MADDNSQIVDAIRTLFDRRGDSAYGGEAVSQREHALQAAALASRDNASPDLVVAALLHDIGHLLHNLPTNAPDHGVDDDHEARAAEWLARWFGPAVVEPVRQHVDAKRFLCATDPDYLDRLSEPSRVSLRLQGGPMTAMAAEAFLQSPHGADAVALRRWDDAAKEPGRAVPDFEVYVPILANVLAAENRGKR